MNSENVSWAVAMLRAVQRKLELDADEDFRVDRGAGEALETAICALEKPDAELENEGGLPPTRELAVRILDVFENKLDELGISLPSEDRTGEKGEARIFGDTYYELEDRITEILDEVRK